MTKLKKDNNRMHSNKFICTNCSKVCYGRPNMYNKAECDYNFCPYCGEPVEKEKSVGLELIIELNNLKAKTTDINKQNAINNVIEYINNKKF